MRVKQTIINDGHFVEIRPLAINKFIAPYKNGLAQRQDRGIN